MNRIPGSISWWVAVTAFLVTAKLLDSPLFGGWSWWVVTFLIWGPFVIGLVLIIAEFAAARADALYVTLGGGQDSDDRGYEGNNHR